MTRIDQLRAALRLVRTRISSGVERVTAAAAQGVGIGRRAGMAEPVMAGGCYEVECYGADGALKWRDTIHNLVTTVGKNALLDNHLAGSAYTAAWYLGLVDNAGFSAYAAADTMSSHAGWSESTAYSNSTRVAVSWNAASAGSKASTTCAFTINATATLDGAFLTTGSAKGGTTGTLYSCGAFSGGDRAVASGDTLNVTYTASA